MWIQFINIHILASPATSSSLMSRVNQMVRFYVNYLTSVTSRLLPEEESLGMSILRLCLDADQPQSLAKGEYICFVIKDKDDIVI